MLGAKVPEGGDGWGQKALLIGPARPALQWDFACAVCHVSGGTLRVAHSLRGHRDLVTAAQGGAWLWCVARIKTLRMMLQSLTIFYTQLGRINFSGPILVFWLELGKGSVIVSPR